MAYRFVHTADLHLDSPLKSLALRDPELAGAVATASRVAFSRIVRRCCEERVDALMIAGDVFDGTGNSVRTALFFASELKRLADAGIETFIVRGNHDSRTAFGRGIDIPDGVHLFGDDGSPVTARGNERVHVHGVSFRDPQAPKSLLPRYGRPDADGIHIGLMHTSLGGAEGHGTYAPCSLSDLIGHGFNYWGLGHVHSRTVHHSSGDAAIVMPGMPQGRDIGEAGPKGATIVTITDDGTVALDEFATALVEFARIDVRIEPNEGWDDVLDRTETALIGAAGAIEGERLAVRLRLFGGSRETWRLVRDADEFVRQLTDRLRRDDPNADSGIFIEKVEVDLAVPQVASERKAANDRSNSLAAMAELRALMTEEAASASFREMARERSERLKNGFPPRTGAIRDATFGATEEEHDEALQRAIRRGLALIDARLHGAEAERTELGAAEHGG